jgi:sugar phosphate isomerase/epimerase
LNLSWSNWGFGIEEFRTSVKRLASNDVRYIELHGNKYGPDLGYEPQKVKRILDDNGLKVSGICGMVSPENELSSNRPHVRQRAIDYFRRQIDMCAELGGTYILFAPGAVGRTQAPDSYEFERAAETIRIVADDFQESGIRGAVEPVRAAEVSFCHTCADAKKLLGMIDHPGVKHIAADLYHILAGESHVAGTLVDYGDDIINLHVADSNRLALGRGVLDLDMVIMALYVIGYNREDAFCSAEPLGPGGDPYPQMHGCPSEEFLDDLVSQTARYFYERESEVLAASDAELRR